MSRNDVVWRLVLCEDSLPKVRRVLEQAAVVYIDPALQPNSGQRFN